MKSESYLLKLHFIVEYGTFTTRVRIRNFTKSACWTPGQYEDLNVKLALSSGWVYQEGSSPRFQQGSSNVESTVVSTVLH